MRKVLFLAFALIAFLGVDSAKAGETPTYEVGYSSFMVTGIRCSSGTVIQINSSRPTGFTANVTGYRVINQDGTNSVWIGGASVSTATAVGDSLTNLGEKLATGASGAWSIGKSYLNNAAVPLIPLYCRAADAAGANGIILSVAWFGY